MSFAFSVSGPFLPLFIIQLGVTPIAKVSLWAGLVASINFLAAAIFSPVWGGLADRTGRKAMVVRSCVAIAVFTALMGLVQNVWQLFAARACMGIFSGFSAAAIAMVGDVGSRREPGILAGLDDDRTAHRRALRAALRWVSRRSSGRFPSRLFRNVGVRARGRAGMRALRQRALSSRAAPRSGGLVLWERCARSSCIRSSPQCLSSCCSRKSSLLACSRSCRSS